MSTDKDQPSSMPTDERPQEYEVGYGKPPSAFRFKKGVSGNPKGRPPGRRLPVTPIEVAHGVPTQRQGMPSSDLSDEELLKMVRARKLTWQALFDLYQDKQRPPVQKHKTPKRGDPTQR